MSIWQKVIIISMLFAVADKAYFYFDAIETEGKRRYDECRIAKNFDCDQRYPKEAEFLRKAIIEDDLKRIISTRD